MKFNKNRLQRRCRLKMLTTTITRRLAILALDSGELKSKESCVKNNIFICVKRLKMYKRLSICYKQENNRPLCHNKTKIKGPICHIQRKLSYALLIQLNKHILAMATCFLLQKTNMRNLYEFSCRNQPQTRF